jgi:1,4-alpha-glucan branching enzyme
MYAQPGKKLLFMGAELGQWNEWYHETSLDWHLLDFAEHEGIRRWVEDLNRLYRGEPALHVLDADPAGFSWVDCNDADNSVISLLRQDPATGDRILAVFNFTPVPRSSYRLGVDSSTWREVLNSDALLYGGSGRGNLGAAEAVPIPCHGRRYSLLLEIPPLASVFFKAERDAS